jgi:hypothetical protein
MGRFIDVAVTQAASDTPGPPARSGLIELLGEGGCDKHEPPAWSRQLTDQRGYKPDIPPPRRNLR